jgi:hypothetical protein
MNLETVQVEWYLWIKNKKGKIKFMGPQMKSYVYENIVLIKS